MLRRYVGSVQIFGREMHHRTSPDYYGRIGVAYEVPNFYNKFTALENLNLFRSLYKGSTADPLSLLEAVGLGEAAAMKVSQLSKGIEDASQLLPCDCARQTNLLTTHNMQAAEDLCDRVAFLVDGQIRLIDSPRALKLCQGLKQVNVEYRTETGLQKEQFAMEGIANDVRFLEFLRDYKIETMHTQEEMLEQIFIEVTGRSLT